MISLRTAISTIALETLLAKAPITPATRSISASLVIAEIPALGSVWLSSWITITSLPFTPPQALIVSTANCIPLGIFCPIEDRSPVIGTNVPNFSSF